MASFQAKMGWKRPTKREKKKLSFRFVPTRSVIKNSKQIAKKFKKFEEYGFGFISSKNRLRNAQKEGK